ncbi:MAG: O-antigen ligase family protein [Bacteroidales bacterium]|nr:O-antigen ligase family protein [Bacteroidales bacterium]
MRQRVHQQLFFICSFALAFFLPVFPKILPIIIVVMTINWLFSGIYLKTVPRLFVEKWRLHTISFISFYLLYLVGMLYSTDYSYGWFDLEVKLSLLIFPIIFATSDLSVYNESRIRLILGSFIGGCITGSLILLGHTWLFNARWGVPDTYYYSNLSWYFHTSYLAMYFTFGVGIMLYYLSVDPFKQSFPKILLLSLLILYLEIFIFLFSSKAGLIMLALTQVLFVILLLYKKIGLTKVTYIFLIMATVFIGFSRIFPFAFKRIAKADTMVTSSQNIQSNPNDGTIARMEIWKISAGLIRQNFFFGVGTGDVKDVLMEAYRDHQLYPVYKKKLNAHNQYIQTFITIGVVGFSLLVATLFIPAIRSLRRGEYLYFIFVLIFAGNILFESMFETQAGVIFYAFFNAFAFSNSAFSFEQSGRQDGKDF